MAKPTRAGASAQTVQQLLSHPYVKRTIEDPEIRDNARAAYASARDAFDRIRATDSKASAIFEDQKLQESLKSTGLGIASARAALVAAPRKKHHFGRTLLILVLGAALALALSEGLRNRVLDLLFGAEEEFDYVSTTAPPEPAAAAAPPEPAPAEPASADAEPKAEEAPAE